MIHQNPLVAYRDCDHCQQFLYDEEKGEPIKTRHKDGRLRKRDRSCPPPCRTERGCPKGTPEDSKALTEANERCYQHYLECKATGAFPDDDLVREHAALIRQAEDIAERGRQHQLFGLLRAAMK